jgi:hypothetical protein
MLLLYEIGLGIFGLITVIRGKMALSSTKVVEGIPAYMLGILAMVPLPLAFTIGLVVGFMHAKDGNEFKLDNENQLMFAVIELGICLVVSALVFGIGASIGKKPNKKRKKHWDDDDDENWDDRIRRSRYEDDNEDERPRRKRRAELEEDEQYENERPRRKRHLDEDDLEEEERPRRKRHLDEEDSHKDDRTDKRRRSLER